MIFLGDTRYCLHEGLSNLVFALFSRRLSRLLMYVEAIFVRPYSLKGLSNKALLGDSENKV